MDTLKAVIYLLFVSVSMNIVTGMLPYAGITAPFTGNLTVGDADPGGLVDSWTSTDESFYDIGTGLVSFWNTIEMIVEGVPMLLEAYGAPFWITEPMYWMYRLLWLTAISLGVIAGRQT